MLSINATLIIQVFNFLILMIILYKILYKPVLRLLDKRVQETREIIEEAEQTRAEAEKELKEYKELLHRGRQEAIQIREEARRRVAEEREIIIKETKEETTRMLDVAKMDIDNEVKRAKGELRKEVADLAVRIAEQIIAKSLDKEDQHRFIQEYLNKIGSLN